MPARASLRREFTEHRLKPYMILAMLGLDHVADTVVGGQMLRCAKALGEQGEAVVVWAGQNAVGFEAQAQAHVLPRCRGRGIACDRRPWADRG